MNTQLHEELSQRAITNLIKYRGVEAIAEDIEGELPEFYTGIFTGDGEIHITYGNREAAVWIPEIEEPIVYFVDSYDDRKIVVQG